MFSESVQSLHNSLIEHYGYDSGHVRVQFGAAAIESDGAAVKGAVGGAAPSELKTEAAWLSKQLTPSDSLCVIVLGHAHHDGVKSYLNLPGAGDGEMDLHGQSFAALFRDLPAEQQVFFITTPVSGYFISSLSAQGRIVITATEPDREVNGTIFHIALADVLSDPSNREELDADENKRFSVFDLYVATTRRIADLYGDDNLQPTEHAQLDDNGDGRGTELQLDYLTEEQGGRGNDETDRPKIRKNSDGFLSQRTILLEEFPE